MAITITVETGAGIANANSYNTLLEVQTFCTDRGLVLPADAETVKAAMIKAMDYLESYRDRLKGCKTAGSNALEFPRVRMKVDGFPVVSNVVPPAAKYAQCRATYEITQSVDLQPTVDGIAIKKEVVGPIETEYQEFLQTVDGKRVLESIDSFIRPMLIPNSGYRLGRNGY